MNRKRRGVKLPNMLDIKETIGHARRAVRERRASDTEVALVVLANEMGAMSVKFEEHWNTIEALYDDLGIMIDTLMRDDDS